MSTAGSPRQRMIGMMYLVLTALLALNVTKEVLDSFILINDDLERITGNTSLKSQGLYDKFREAENRDPLRVKPYREKADQVKTLSEKMLQDLKQLKKTLVTMVGIDEHGIIKSKEDMDKPSELMITKKNGIRLKEEIENYKQELKKIIALVDKDAVKRISLGLELKEHKEKDGTVFSWESKNFENVPVVAVVAILSSIETEVKNAETSVASYLFDKINDHTNVVDAFEAKVISPSSYILAGEKYEANVFLAAYNSTLTPQILVNSDTVNQQKITAGMSSMNIEKGMGRYEIQTSGEGLVKWGGKIRMAGPEGKMIEYPFHSEFMVAKPSVTISPTKMNVFYTMVQNPVSISAPGIPTENLLPPDISTGILTGSKGNYFVTVSEPGKMVTITVRARIGGAIKEIGSSVFRVRKLQDPIAKVANLTGGIIEARILKLQAFIYIESGNAEFNLVYPCLGYTLSVSRSNEYIPRPASSNGLLTQSSKDYFGNLRTGDKVFFDDIKVRMPDGKTKILNPIYFTIKN